MYGKGGMHGDLGVCVVKGGVHGEGGMHGRGTCMAGGVHGGGMHGRVHAWWGCAWQEGCAWQGVCMAGGHAWQGNMHGGGVHGREACVAGETATVADGTHPTAMHSCLLLNSLNSVKHLGKTPSS